MIKKLQKRFIRIAVVTLAAAMVLAVGAVNVANWFSVRGELRDTLAFLAENSEADTRGGGRAAGKTKHVQNVISEANWFSAHYDRNGGIRAMNLKGMADADEEAAIELAARALASGKSAGFIEDYIFQIADGPEKGGVAVFLNCETKLTAVRTLAVISALACLACVALAWLIVSLASRRAVEPTIRNMEQQKQFITNASHELKTPLTVIGANMDLLQAELPGNQWIRSTQKQTAQMRRLVDELVYLSRLEEEGAALEMEDIPLKPLVAGAAEPFEAMAEFSGRELEVDVGEDLWIRGDRASLQRLLSILCDNAVKYASGGGPIRVGARAEGRMVRLSVSNAVETPLTGEQCQRLFDRFYRADPSRSKEKQGGFGIGLAIAAAIAEKHGGGISAAMADDNRLEIACALPRGGREQ